MSRDIVAAGPLSRNDISQFAMLIHENLREFQSNLSPLGTEHINLLGFLVGLGFGAATASGAVLDYEPHLRSFLISHPVKRKPVLLNSFSLATAKMINLGAHYFDLVEHKGAQEDFLTTLVNVRDEMALNLCDKAEIIRFLLRPILEK